MNIEAILLFIEFVIFLRQEQLGYIVFSGIRKVNGANGIRIIVQSSKHPSFVEDRIESFLENYLKVMEEMPLDEFERHKEALALKKLEKPKNVSQQFHQFYSEIALAQYHFERDEAEVAILRKITKEEFLECFKSFIARDGPERRVLSVHIISTQLNQDDKKAETPEEEAIEITNMERHEKIIDLEAFKSSKELYPICLPVLDIKSKGARSKL
ncbi:insulin-degrading enzyme [Rhagoletis pomonella]|uniref:insulin-degrading enzyme n=1 Tax=Rhagoletis pomonella TaxID=28610 RepID=UPI001781CA5A|nr:insulin-degrading enzyme [Rhagoletis pomonella]